MKRSIENIIDSSQNRLLFRSLGALLFIELSVIFFLFLAQSFGQDEIESIHDAWKIFLGQRIFIDFFEHHHPFFYYLLVPVVAVFKENVMVMIAGRMLVFLMFLLILAVTYIMARNLYGKISAIISLVLLPATNIFIIRAIQIRPEVPQTLFGLLALSFLFSYFERNSLKYLILSSIFLAVSFLFLQIAVFFIFAVLALLSFEVLSNRIKPRDVILFLLAFTAVLLPYYMYLVFSGELHNYMVYNWGANSYLLRGNLPWVSKLIPLFAHSFKQNILLWIFWPLSLLFLDTPNKKRMGAITLLYFTILISIDAFWPQYYILVIPLIVIMAANAVWRVSCLFLKKGSWVVGSVVVFYIFSPFNTYLNTIKASPSARELREMKYVLSVTKPRDFVYDGAMKVNLFRKDLDFFWFSLNLSGWFHNRYHYSYSVYQLIDKFKPKVITPFSKDINDRSIASHYRRSDKYPDLFIRVN